MHDEECHIIIMSSSEEEIRQLDVGRSYSKRHAKRLKKKSSSSESKPVTEDPPAKFSEFKRHLKRCCPSSASTFVTSIGDVTTCSATQNDASQVAFFDSASVIDIPTFSSCDGTVVAEQSNAHRNFPQQSKQADSEISIDHMMPTSSGCNISSVNSAAEGRFTSSSCSSSISYLDLSSILPIHELSSLHATCQNSSSLPESGITATISYEKIRTFRKDLQIYCVENKLTHVSINNLLGLLNSLPPFSMLPKHLALPRDARTLLRTMRKVGVKEIAEGEFYVHIGLKEILQLYYVLVRKVDTFDCFIGIDGVPISESSCGHFIPIMCAIIPDDPDEESYVSAIGIWYADKTKPSDSNKFLGPFVKEVEDILKEGVSIDGKTIPVSFLGYTFDAVGKSEILGIVSHSGYFACPRCKIRGKYVGGVHFPGVETHAPRSHDEFKPNYEPDYIPDSEGKLHKDTHHHKYTVLEKIPGVDLVNQVVCDPMHILWIGVTKYTLKLIVTGDQSIRLSEADVKRVNKRHEKLRKSLPREFARTLKSISKYFKWKATQGRQFTLYLGIVTLFKILPDEQYQNFLLLHAACFIIFHPTLSKKKKYQDRADTFFREFILTFGNIYGDNHVTFNIHMLTHLVDDLVRFKNLNRCSAFQFENFLGILTRLLRKGHLPLSQAVKRIAEKSCAALAKKQLEEDEIIASNKVGVTYSQAHQSGPLLEGCASPQFHSATFRQKSSSCRSFTLRASTQIKDNCCVMKNKEVVLVQNFAMSTSGEMNILFQKFLNKSDFYLHPIKSSKLGILKVDTLSEAIESAPVSDIRNKCVLVHFKRGTYVAVPMLHSS